MISLDQFGELVIGFNQPMKTNMNITFLNSSISSVGRQNNLTRSSEIDSKFKNIFDIYVVPNDKWNEYVEGFEMKQINLTWFVTNFTSRELKLQVDFFNMTYLSPNEIQDRLLIHFSENQTIFR